MFKTLLHLILDFLFLNSYILQRIMKYIDKENFELLLSLLIYTCISANCTVSILRSVDPIALGNGILILKNES